MKFRGTLAAAAAALLLAGCGHGTDASSPFQPNASNPSKTKNPYTREYYNRIRAMSAAEMKKLVHNGMNSNQVSDTLGLASTHGGDANTRTGDMAWIKPDGTLKVHFEKDIVTDIRVLPKGTSKQPPSGQNPGK